MIGTGGVGPHGGPIYKYDSESTSETKFPEYYHNSVVFGEFTRPGFVFDNPMEMRFGPDGSLYLLEYCDGFFRPNPDAQLSRARARTTPTRVSPSRTRGTSRTTARSTRPTRTRRTPTPPTAKLTVTDSGRRRPAAGTPGPARACRSANRLAGTGCTWCSDR